MGWDGMGWDGTGRDGTGQDGMGWDGMGLGLIIADVKSLSKWAKWTSQRNFDFLFFGKHSAGDSIRFLCKCNEGRRCTLFCSVGVLPYTLAYCQTVTIGYLRLVCAVP